MFLFSLFKVNIWNMVIVWDAIIPALELFERDVQHSFWGGNVLTTQHAETSSYCKHQLCYQCEASSLGRQRLRFQQSLVQ